MAITRAYEVQIYSFIYNPQHEIDVLNTLKKTWSVGEHNKPVLFQVNVQDLRSVFRLSQIH